MDSIIAIAIVAIIILIFLVRAEHRAEAFDNLRFEREQERAFPMVDEMVSKEVPIEQAKEASRGGDSVVIDAIPLTQSVPQIEVADPGIAPVYSDRKPHVSLSYDASVARNALMRSRDKRVFDAIAQRTTEYYRPFFEQELRHNDTLDWWDDIAYPMNDSGETQLSPQYSPSDREATPWESDEVPFVRSI